MNYHIIEHFLSDDDIKECFKLSELNFSEGKVGTNINYAKKIRSDATVRRKECKYLDEKIFKKQDELNCIFGSCIEYREQWKVGHYIGSSETGGHYIQHRDTQGSGSSMHYRKISIVIMLSDPGDYEGGELHFSELDKKIKLEKGSVIFFDPNLLHGVQPVTAGERFVFISFLFDSEGAKMKGGDVSPYTPLCTVPEITKTKKPKGYLLPLLPDSGPGNQVIGIKESLIISKKLGRIPILPNICQHYIKGQSFFNFEDIFSYPENYKSINDIQLKINTTYCLHGNYINKQLKLEKYLNIDAESQNLTKRTFRNDLDFQELNQKKEEILVVKHLFNNVAISQCCHNGCTECNLNSIFLNDYIDICSKLDFSDLIKEKGDHYIQNNIQGDYLSFHLRYPDYMYNKTLKEHSGYSEDDIYNILVSYSVQRGIKKIFIATNKKSLLLKSKLKGFFVYTGNSEVDSFIEQYICCKSNIFIMNKYNDYSDLKKPHQRSTWSSFVYDYRTFLLKKYSNFIFNDIKNYA